MDNEVFSLSLSFSFSFRGLVLRLRLTREEWDPRWSVLFGHTFSFCAVATLLLQKGGQAEDCEVAFRKHRNMKGVESHFFTIDTGHA